MTADTKGEQRVAKRYAHAPITEAVIELRVLPRKEATLDSCKSFLDGIRPEGAKIQAIHLVEAEFTGGAKIGAQAKQSIAGYRLVDEKTHQVLAAHPDRFAFSQLAPYDHWQSFQAEATRFWLLYREAMKPEKVTRVATRFINRVDVPMPIAEISDYFKTAPTLSPEMPQNELGPSLMQLTLPQIDLDCSVVLNFASLGALGETSTAAFILDIDVFDDHSDFSSDEVIWNRLNQFRWRKNDIFEACITDKVRELIS